MRKLFFLVSICGVINVAVSGNILSRSWGDAPSKIQVNTMKTSIEVPINDDTVVLNVKEFLSDSEGIPVNQQALCLIKLYYHGLLKDTIELSNDVNVKCAINLYGTQSFALFIKLNTH